MTAIFFDILCISNLVEPLLLETLYSIRNFIANCDTTKKLLLEPIKTSTKVVTTSSSLIDILVHMAQKSHLSDDAFYGCIENLKILALHGESRAVLLKVCENCIIERLQLNQRAFLASSLQSTLLSQMTDSLARYLKARDYGRAEALVQFLINLSLNTDSQTQVIRAPGGVSFQRISNDHMLIQWLDRSLATPYRVTLIQVPLNPCVLLVPVA